jgi:hypothetical protein
MNRIGAVVALTMLCMLTIPAYSSTCSNTTLKGAYSYHDTQEDPDGTKWYIVGYLQFDGAGNGRTNWIFHNSNGDIENDQVGLPLTYTVDQTCTFSFTQQNGLTFSGVFGNNTNELDYVETTGWQFRRGSATKVTTQR